MWELYVGRKRTGITVRPDAIYAGMWRIHQAGEVSDMVNLTRAKDAARTWVDAKGSEYRRMHWVMRPSTANRTGN